MPTARPRRRRRPSPAPPPDGYLLWRRRNVVHDQLAWYIAGPLLGLCVVAVRALFSARLGVTGGFSELVEKVSGRSLDFDWRGWFALGIVASGTLYLVLWG